MKRTYSDLIKLETFKERFDYLKLSGSVGSATFGGHRYINQAFYQSDEWKKIRRFCILRDCGCDLALPGYDIQSKLTLHHINPVTIEQVMRVDRALLDPENLVCCSYMTHKAIHYSDDSLLPFEPVERHPGDTKLW